MNEPTQFLVDYLAKPPAQSVLGRFAEGFFTPIVGAAFLRKNPSLLTYTIAPFLINLVATTLAAITLFSAAGYLFYQLGPEMVGESNGLAWWFWVGVATLVGLASLLLVALVVVILWKILTGVLCGYFYGLLAEKVERLLGLPESEIESISLMSELVDNILNVLLLILAFLVGFIPLIGNVLGLWGGCLILGLDFLGYPLALRGDRRHRQVATARRHLAETTGLGSALLLVQFVPILGAMLSITGVIGAIFLNRRLQSKDDF